MGCRGHFTVSGGIRGCRDVKGVLGASRNSRYSGTRRGIESIRGIGDS